MITPNATDAEALFQYGNSLLNAGNFEEALAYFAESLKLRPEHPEVLANTGVACAELGRVEEALGWYEAAIRVRPQYPAAHYNRGNALNGLKRYAEAIEAYDQALGYNSKLAFAWNNRGRAFMLLGQASEAARSYQEALKLQPSFPEARNNYALALQILGNLEDAIQNLNECILFHPNFVPAHTNLAQALLLKGDFARGWYEYEWRYHLPTFQGTPRELPPWDGSPLRGRSILLWSEQGLGDTIQFVRYVSLIRQLGPRVVLECPPSLHPVLESFEGIDRLIDRSTAETECDCHAPLLSLPGLFRTDGESVPCRIPYLTAQPSRVDSWRELLPDDPLLIGICWRGSPGYPEDVYRSIPLNEFAPLADLPGVQLISLQKGLGTEQIAEFRKHHSLFEFDEDFDRDKPFLDTAAVMSCLDLIVTADTSIAHLAGALGRPVWLALTVSPDWRWLLKRNDSPWYPSVRLFRQPNLGNWSAVFKEMAEAIGRGEAPGVAAASSRP